MVQGSGLGRALADQGSGSGAGGGRCGILVVVILLLPGDDRAGGGVDLVVVLVSAAVELDLVDYQAIVPIQLALVVGDAAGGDARVVQGSGLGRALADQGSGSGAGGGRCGILVVVILLLPGDDRAGGGVDLVVVLVSAAVELDLVDYQAIVPIQLALVVGDAAGGDARVVQGSGLGRALADQGSGGGDYGVGCGVVVQVLLPGEDLAGGGVDLVLVLVSVRVEGDFVDHSAVLLLQLALILGDGVRGDACVAQGSGLGLVSGDLDIGGGGGGSLLAVLLGFQDLAGGGVDLILKLVLCGFEVHLVDQDAVFHVQVQLQLHQVGLGHTGGLQGDGGGGFRADVALVAGGSGGVHALQALPAGHADQVQLIDGQPHQGLEGVAAVLADDGLDQLGLAQGDAVFLRQGGQLVGLAYGLGQHGALKGIGAEQRVHLFGQLGLELRAFFGVVILHADEDGVGQLGQVAVAQHGAQQRVHCHVQVAALQLHIPKDNFAVLIQGFYGNYGFILIEPKLQAGVHIQGHHGGYRVGTGVAVDPQAQAKHQHQGGGQGGCPHPYRAGFFTIYNCHFCSISFLLFALGENSIQDIGRGLFKCLLQFLFCFPVRHAMLSFPDNFSVFSGSCCTLTAPLPEAYPKMRRFPCA